MSAVTFQPLFPVLWVFLISGILLVIFCWLEIKRSQKWLAYRLLATFLAIVSLTCIVLNPFMVSNEKTTSILLTPNYRQAILDSLLVKNPGSKLFTLPENLFPGAETIENYRSLETLNGNLFILGEGLPDYMMDYVDTSFVQFYEAPMPVGFIDIKLDKTYKLNRVNQLEGLFNSSLKNYVLKLKGPGGIEDSTRIYNTGTYKFSLNFIPKTTGPALYTLIASDSIGKIRYSEQVPVIIANQIKLSFLFLLDYPTAEIRFLKNYLESEKHKIAIRYTVSRNKFRTEFVNTKTKSINTLSPEMLLDYDLIVTDAGSLSSLSESDYQTFKKAMLDGLGILTLIDTSIPSKRALNFLEIKTTVIKGDSAMVALDREKIKMATTSLTLNSEKKIFEVGKDVSGRILSGYTHHGLGKNGFQLINNTYSLQLAGENKIYAKIWSPSIDRIARTENKKYKITITTPFPYYEDEPISFQIIASHEKPDVYLDSVRIPLLESALIDNVFYGKIWITEPGWHSIFIPQDSTVRNFFVPENNHWNSLRAVNQIRSFKALRNSVTDTAGYLDFKPIPPLLFYILFLIAAGFLWLAPKL